MTWKPVKFVARGQPSRDSLALARSAPLGRKQVHRGRHGAAADPRGPGRLPVSL